MSFRLPWLLVVRGLLPHLKAVNERKKAWQGALKCRDSSWQHSWSFSRWRGREMWDLQCLGRLGPTYWFLHTKRRLCSPHPSDREHTCVSRQCRAAFSRCLFCLQEQDRCRRLCGSGDPGGRTQSPGWLDGCLHSSAWGCTGLLWTLRDPTWSPVSQNLHCAILFTFWAASISPTPHH